MFFFRTLEVRGPSSSTSRQMFQVTKGGSWVSGKTRIDHYDNNNIRERGRCVATQTNTRARCTAAVTMYFLLMIMGCDAMCIRVPTTSFEDARAGKGRGRGTATPHMERDKMRRLGWRNDDDENNKAVQRMAVARTPYRRACASSSSSATGSASGSTASSSSSPPPPSLSSEAEAEYHAVHVFCGHTYSTSAPAAGWERECECGCECR